MSRPRINTPLNLDADLWSRIQIIAKRRHVAVTELISIALWQTVLDYENED